MQALFYSRVISRVALFHQGVQKIYPRIAHLTAATWSTAGGGDELVETRCAPPADGGEGRHHYAKQGIAPRGQFEVIVGQ